MRRCLLLLAVAACGGQPQAARAPEPAIAAPSIILRSVSEPVYRQSSDSAIRAFIPAVPAADSAGRCTLTRSRGSGATRVTAQFRARDSSSTTVTLWFDSVGSLVRFHDSRGFAPIRLPGTLVGPQRDSAFTARINAQAMTFISLDFATDEANAMNQGAGNRRSISGTVRELENLPALGPPVERIKRVRKLCGV